MPTTKGRVRSLLVFVAVSCDTDRRADSDSTVTARGPTPQLAPAECNIGPRRPPGSSGLTGRTHCT